MPNNCRYRIFRALDHASRVTQAPSEISAHVLSVQGNVFDGIRALYFVGLLPRLVFQAAQTNSYDGEVEILAEKLERKALEIVDQSFEQLRHVELLVLAQLIGKDKVKEEDPHVDGAEQMRELALSFELDA